MTLAEMSYRHTSGVSKAWAVWPHGADQEGCRVHSGEHRGRYGRDNRGSYIQFLRIAQGSCKELETHVLLAGRVLGDVASKPEPVLNQSDVVGKMLRGLIRSLQFS